MTDMWNDSEIIDSVEYHDGAFRFEVCADEPTKVFLHTGCFRAFNFTCYRSDDDLHTESVDFECFLYICGQKRSIRNSRSLRLSPVDSHQKQEPLPGKQVQASGLRVRNRPFSYFLNIAL